MSTRRWPGGACVVLLVAALATVWTAGLLGGCGDGKPAASRTPTAAGSPLPGGWSFVGLGGSDITGLSFIDERTGWASSSGIPADAAGKNGVWRTADGGATWEILATARFHDIWFRDESVGWGLAVDSGLYRSEDGGATWARRPIEDEPESLYQVRFADARHGFIAAGQYGAEHGGWVLVTADGGDTWRVRVVTDTPVRTVFFAGVREGWAAGDQDVAHTVDGGRTWEVQLHRGNGGLSASDVWFADRLHGWLASGHGGGIWATVDGGKTWRRTWRGAKTGVYAVRFLDATTGWAVGIRYPPEAGEDGSSAASAAPGAATGIVLSTTDGGQTWQEQIVNQVGGLFDLATLGDDQLVVAGDSAVLRHPVTSR